MGNVIAIQTAPLRPIGGEADGRGEQDNECGGCLHGGGPWQGILGPGELILKPTKLQTATDEVA